MRIVKYTCPYCGKEIEVNVYDTIYADEETELRDRVVSGDLFRVSCPHCKHEFMIQYPLVYIDRNHHFLLWLSTENPGSALRQLTEPLVKNGYKLRRCSTLQEMVEKIQIFEDEVNDAVVELAKYDSFIEFVNNKKGRPEDVTSVEYQNTNNGVIKINVRTDDRGMSFLIPISVIEEEMMENDTLYYIDNETIPVINTEWLIDLYQKADGQA